MPNSVRKRTYEENKGNHSLAISGTGKCAKIANKNHIYLYIKTSILFSKRRRSLRRK